eukprot:scaffold9072_cov49-Attheya_sp.AAC.4
MERIPTRSQSYLYKYALVLTSRKSLWQGLRPCGMQSVSREKKAKGAFSVSSLVRHNKKSFVGLSPRPLLVRVSPTMAQGYGLVELFKSDIRSSSQHQLVSPPSRPQPDLDAITMAGHSDA